MRRHSRGPGVYATGYGSGADAEEAEGFGLERGGAGEDIGGHGPLCGGLNAVAGERGEVGQQGLEAVDGQAAGGAFPAGLGVGRGRGTGGGDGRGSGGLGRGGIVVVEEQRRERAAHVPLDVVGEHAEEDVGPDPAFEAVVDRAHLEIHGLVAAERPLDAAQALVGPDRLFGGSSAAGTLVRMT